MKWMKYIFQKLLKNSIFLIISFNIFHYYWKIGEINQLFSYLLILLIVLFSKHIIKLLTEFRREVIFGSNLKGVGPAASIYISNNQVMILINN